MYMPGSRAPFLSLCLAAGAAAHGFLTCPAPRQRRNGPIPGQTWTMWMGMSGGSYGPGIGNAQSLSAGGRNPSHANPGTRDLCGGTLANHFSAGSLYGPTEARGTFVSGGTMDVTVRLTAYHKGWFEFRLAVPAGDTQDISQDLLNEHVLEIDPSTDEYEKATDYAGVQGAVKCRNSGG